MKQRNKGAAVLLSVLLLLSAAAGCGTSDAQSASSSQTSSVQATKASVADTWYLGGNTASSYLVLKANGTVESYQPGGKKLATGTYQIDGNNVNLTMVSTSGTKEKKPDQFELTDANTLYFVSKDRTYTRAAAAKAAEQKAVTRQDAADKQQVADAKARGISLQPLSDASLTAADVIGTWNYQGDATQGSVTFASGGRFTSAKKSGDSFSGLYKISGSRIGIYDEQSGLLFNFHMQKNGQLTDNMGKTSYQRASSAK